MSGIETKDRIEKFLSDMLSKWVMAICGRGRSIATLNLILTLLLLVYAGLNLRVNSDSLRLIAADLPARLNHEEFAKIFPNLENALFIVVDGATPELARAGEAALTERLIADTANFEDIYVPGGGEFFERNGLLYRSPEELDDFADQMAGAQPIIAELERDPSIANLANLIELGLAANTELGGSAANWPTVLDHVGDATISVFTEFPVAISWEEMILQGSSIDSTTRRVIVAHPILDFSNAFSAGNALDSIRSEAKSLGLTPDKGVTVRVTGNPALNYEELIDIALDIGMGGAFCFVIVIGVLFRALRSLPLVLASVITLLSGLIWTAALACVTPGQLNVVSLSVSVLYIGLGVDFGIHIGMRYGDLVCKGASHLDAMRAATESVGGSLVICAFTTAIGFFVFIPTDYLGVAELGQIAGTGMFIILFQTMTLLPALLTCWFRVDPEKLRRRSFRFRRPWWRFFERVPGWIALGALLAGLASLALFDQLRFDPNVINMRNPNSESVQAFNDLLEQAGTASPWYINSIAPNLAAAEERAARFRELDVVDQTLVLSSFVPEEQEEKLAILDDIAFMMEETLYAPPPQPDAKIDAERQIRALRELHDFLASAPETDRRSPLYLSMRLLQRRLGEFIDKIEKDEDPAQALESLETILLSTLPDQIARLRNSLDAQPITLDDLPEELVKRMIAPDGRARIQVFPSETLQSEDSFARFVDAVSSIDPQAAGVAVNLTQFGRAIRDSFRQALISAVVVIVLLLWLLWRRMIPVALVIAPLLLSSILTCATMVLLDIPFQFVNVIVIPLLLGIGVDSGIHLVHRAELIRESDEHLMETTTARAVFYSALTTTVSFGSLALSGHRGLAAMGVLLSVGMILSAFCNLIVLPALIQLRQRRQALRD